MNRFFPLIFFLYVNTFSACTSLLRDDSQALKPNDRVELLSTSSYYPPQLAGQPTNYAMLSSQRFCKALLIVLSTSSLVAIYQECFRSRQVSLSRREQAEDVFRSFEPKDHDRPDPGISDTLPLYKQFLYDYNTSVIDKYNVKSVNYLQPLLLCNSRLNPYTNHRHLPHIVQNISQRPSGSETKDDRQLFNPTIIALPSWSKNEYLLVSRVVTEGLHQESLICEANACHPSISEGRHGESVCSPEDLEVLGSSGGLRCATEPQVINLPPTPAEQCDGKWRALTTIPGFHDPRIFWSGKGEPLIILNSQ